MVQHLRTVSVRIPDHLIECMSTSITWLFILALPIACISWTLTHEEVFKEAREFCQKRSDGCKSLLQRKFFYLFTCEYCFSHYVTILVLMITQYKLLIDDWRGYFIAGFSLVWMANVYMSLFGLIRQNIKLEKIKGAVEEEKLATKNDEKERTEGQQAAG